MTQQEAMDTRCLNKVVLGSSISEAAQCPITQTHSLSPSILLG